MAAAMRLCETCRERRAHAGGYCDRLCAAFDAALADHAAALADADNDPLAAPVVLSRTRLRAVAEIYDERRLRRNRWDRLLYGDPAAWAEDVAAGLLLPVAHAAAVDEARRRIG